MDEVILTTGISGGLLRVGTVFSDGIRLAARPLTGLRHALIGRERIHHVVGEVTIRTIVRKRAAKRSAPTNGLRRDQSCAASHRERRGCSERPSRHERLLSRVPITLASRWSIASAPTAR